MQYNQTGPFHRDYNSAITALDNFLIEFPGSSFKEQAMYYKFDSAYKLAMNSVKWKQTERVEKALTFYNSLLYVFPETQNNEDIQAMYEDLKSIQTNSTTTKS